MVAPISTGSAPRRGDLSERFLETDPSRGSMEAEHDLDLLDMALLRRRWRGVMGRAAPAALSRALIIRILFWREQVALSGDLDAQARALLDSYAESRLGAGGTPIARSGSSGLRSGSVLVREHAGVHHRVTALDQGYLWNNQTFGSLSAVARAITGTNWNGRRFFGLDQPVGKPKGQVQSSSASRGQTGARSTR